MRREIQTTKQDAELQESKTWVLDDLHFFIYFRKGFLRSADDESVDLPEDALIVVLHELEVALHVAQVAADLAHAAAHLLQDGRERRVDVHDDLEVVGKVPPRPARGTRRYICRHMYYRVSRKGLSVGCVIPLLLNSGNLG